MEKLTNPPCQCRRCAADPKRVFVARRGYPTARPTRTKTPRGWPVAPRGVGGVPTGLVRGTRLWATEPD